MAICPIDADGFCSRHKRKHYGRESHWALDDSPTGEEYRQIWDSVVRPQEQPQQQPQQQAPVKEDCGCRKRRNIH